MQTIPTARPSYSCAGVSRRGWKYRAGWDGHAWNGEEGALNARAGFKLDALDQSGIVPELAIIPEVLIPTGDDELAPDEVEGELRLAGGYVLSPVLAFGGNANFAQRQGVFRDGHFFEFAGSATLGLSITDALGGYIEYFTIKPDDLALADSEFTDVGVTYIVAGNIQLDVFAGFGLDDNADHFFAGGGVVFVW
jgi:Putative MetA-pathway of phenol degradation